MASRDESTGEFYVGYLPGPPGYVRFLRRLVPGVLLVAVLLGCLVIGAHNNPGDATWEIDAAREFAGVIDVRPYAMLRVVGSAPDRPVETLLLVSEGKFGARDRAESFRARTVRVRGTLLSRQGRRLFEIADGDCAIEPIDAATLPDAERLRNPVVRRIGEATLRGEIIDPKCYFGAMKPGEGKAHKDCAALCISGGKPNPVHTFDCGAAFENLALQGAAMGLVVHGMAGFDRAKARTELQVPDEYDVEAMIAVGRPGDPAQLPEDLRQREVPSGRKPVAEFVCEGRFAFTR